MLASAEVAAAQAAAAGCPFNFTTLTDADGAYSLTVPYALSLHMATATLSYERAGFASETRAVSLDATILAADAARYAWVEGTRNLAGAKPNASSSVECVSSGVDRVMIVVCCVALCCVVWCCVVLFSSAGSSSASCRFDRACLSFSSCLPVATYVFLAARWTWAPACVLGGACVVLV